MKFLRLAAPLLALALPLHSHAQTEVEPGVTLTSPVAVVEPTATGPTVQPIHPTAILDNAHIGSNIARGLVYSNQHNTIEIAGVTSNLVLTSPTPVFYIHIDPDDPNNQRQMAALIRLKPTSETRIVLTFTANAFGGSRKRHVTEVDITKTDLPGNWLKLTPNAPLAPGEYGLVSLPAQTLLAPGTVYAFTVAPK